MSSRRDERKVRTREAILTAARKCFSEEGLAATSTGSVAVAAGISHGTLFLHFPRREALIEQVVTELTTALRAQLGAPPGSLADELALQLRLLIGEERLLARLLREESGLPPAARDAHSALDRELAARVAAAYVADRERLGLRSHSPRLVAATWLGLLQRVLLRGEPDETGFSPLARWGPELREHCLALVAR